MVILILDDVFSEPRQFFRVDLQSDNATIVESTAIVVIEDNDPGKLVCCMHYSIYYVPHDILCSAALAILFSQTEYSTTENVSAIPITILLSGQLDPGTTVNAIVSTSDRTAIGMRMYMVYVYHGGLHHSMQFSWNVLL